MNVDGNTSATNTGLGGPAPIGLCLLDHDLRIVSLNPRLAEINEKPEKAHLGRTIAEVFPPDLVAQLEPACRRVLESSTPSVNLEYTGPSSDGAPCHWLISIRPAIPVAGFAAALHLAVEDITLRKQRELAEADQLRFERLIADISIRFVNLPAGRVDEEIDAALGTVVSFIDADRGSVVLMDDEAGTMEATHSFAKEGGDPFPPRPH